MNRDGSGSRVLLAASREHEYVDPLDWSPTDEEILVAGQGREDRVWELLLVSAADGSRRVLKTLSWVAPGGMGTYPRAYFSPDGRHVAYDHPSDPEERGRDIYALAVDGTGETTLVSGPGSDRLLGWLPDGSGILFYSDRGGAPSVRRLPVRDGTPDGEAELVRSEVPSLIPLGFVADGYAYGVTVRARRIHTATVDPGSGRMPSPPRPVDDPPSLRSLAADWSPDGERLAYITHRAYPEVVETLVIRSVEGEASVGGEGVRSVPLSPTFHTSSATLDWVREGTIFLFGVEKGHNGIYRLDPGDGSFRRVPGPGTDEDAAYLKWFEVGPDGETIYLIRPGAGADGTGALIARDASTGEERALGSTRADGRSLAVSPDGEVLATIVPDDGDGSSELRVRSVRDGSARTLLRLPQGRLPSAPLAWTPDGAWLLFVRRTEDGGCSLWSLPASGDGGPRRLGEGDPCPAGNDIRVHPDGRRIAFAAGTDRGEVRVLEGF